MTAIESLVTITTSPVGATARCECGWTTKTYAGNGFQAWARRRVETEWADHWAEKHESETTGD